MEHEPIRERPDRPNYTQLRRSFQHIEAYVIVKTPIPIQHKETWVQAQLDVHDTLLELLPGNSRRVILAPNDTRTEHARVTNADIALHDWLKIYEEKLKQEPPEGLLDVKQVLAERRAYLDRLYPPEGHKSD